MLVASSQASASVASFTGSAGTRAASVSFDTSGSDLIVTLTNTSSVDAMQPTDVLTAVYFNIGGPIISLGRVSAILGAGSVVVNGPVDPGNVVGGEWAYLGGSGSLPGGARYGISSTGMGVFGPGDRFPGSDLESPTSPDGLQYGITTAGDNALTGNGGISGTGLIKNSVVFTLSGLPSGFDPSSQIGSVTFQYGTALDEPQVPAVPAPGAIALLACAGLVVAGRRR
jgi:hypothetical protein